MARTEAPQGQFTRDHRYITTRITADGRDGYPVEPGRYRLVVSRACPWASRAVIVRRLLGLEDVLSMGIAGPTHDERSWTFDLDPGGRDPVLGIERLQEAFFARFPDYDQGHHGAGDRGRADRAGRHQRLPADHRGPVLEWRPYHREGAPDLYPPPLRDEIDEVMDGVFTDVNNGVYRCGFAGSPGGVRPGVPAAVRRARRAVGAAGRPALPGRRHDHRGGRAAVHHAGPVRRRSTTATSSATGRS